MTSFIGRLPVSVIFSTDSSRCLVAPSVARDLGYSAPDSRFSEILTASYDGRALTTDIEFEVSRSIDCDVLIGMNWIAAWRAVGREYEHPAHNPYSRGASGLQGDSILSYPVFRTYIRQYSHASSGPSDVLSMSPVPIRIPAPLHIHIRMPTSRSLILRS
ncbi:hypothetical protein EV424DRAFT_1546564 [Suillus variegatus]|nr:hypothetical protein EV424DRAFT_1546564 [Suillus variegatus]